MRAPRSPAGDGPHDRARHPSLAMRPIVHRNFAPAQVRAWMWTWTLLGLQLAQVRRPCDLTQRALVRAGPGWPRGSEKQSGHYTLFAASGNRSPEVKFEQCCSETTWNISDHASWSVAA